MEILEFDYLRDGGTCKIKTSEGTFCFDYRIGSTTKSKLYNGLPKDDNSNIIPDSEDLEIRIIEALKTHGDSIYKQKINWLINQKTRKQTKLWTEQNYKSALH